MADGTPELTTKRLGEEIARLRNRKGKELTRTALASRALRLLKPGNPLENKIGENWLARLEDGRMVKVSHEAIEILCEALECTPSERAAVLMHANRNPLADTQGNVPPEAELLGQIMLYVYQKAEVQETLRQLKNSSKNPRLSEDEINKLAQTIAEAIENNAIKKQKAAGQKPAA